MKIINIFEKINHKNRFFFPNSDGNFDPGPGLKRSFKTRAGAGVSKKVPGFAGAGAPVGL